MADLLPPPPQIIPKPLYHTLLPKSRLVRIFDPTQFSASALGFRSYGPISRFDHQRLPLKRGAAADYDPDRRVMYAAPTLSSCIVEVFGDTMTITRNPYQVAFLTVARGLRLLNLCGNGAMRAGTLPVVCKDGRRQRTQEGAQYFYEQAIYFDNGVKVDGLWYSNAHNDETAVALFESCENALVCGSGDILALANSSLRPTLSAIADEHNMVITP